MVQCIFFPIPFGVLTILDFIVNFPFKNFFGFLITEIVLMVPYSESVVFRN